MQIRFSIVIPLYNKEQYIVRCLNSVYSQTYKDFEVIVVNDGSTDSGAQLIKEQFPNVILIEQENQGVSCARNLGIERSKNQYIAFLDADDAWHPQYLALVKSVIGLNNNVKIVGSHYSNYLSVINTEAEQLNYYEIKDYFKIAIKNTLFSSSSTVIKRDVILNNNIVFDSSLKGGEDLDFWFRVNLTYGKAFYIENTLIYYSNEDMLQATRSLPPLNRTLVGKIGASYKQHYKHNPYLKKFVSHYVSLNIFPYYYNSDSHKSAKALLREIPYKNLLLTIPYRLPISVGTSLINNLASRRYFRLYLKLMIKATT